MITLTPKAAKKALIDVLKANLVPMMYGTPGTGKSAIVSSIADAFNLQLIDVRLSQCDPTDLMGFPSTDGNKARYLPMNMFPVKGDALPTGKKGWLLFLDEMNSASLAVQAASYKLVFDKAVGQYPLHPSVAIICAGNNMEDGAITNEMSTALQSRLIHINLEPDHEDFIEHAQLNNFDYRITSYLQFRPAMLNTFDPNHSDKTFACPRTWEFASKLLSLWDDISFDNLALLAGTIGEGAAREFINYCRVFNDLPDIKKIERNPTGEEVPREPSTLYALSALIADSTTDKSVTPFLTYVSRMPKEFQIITIKEMSRRYPQIVTNDVFKTKVKELASYI